MSRPATAVFRAVNAVEPLFTHPRLMRLLRMKAARLRYTGRRSGRTITLTVWCRPTPDGVVVDVGVPSQKTWWRNFRTPAPIDVLLDGSWRSGTAVVGHPKPGRVRVRVVFG